MSPFPVVKMYISKCLFYVGSRKWRSNNIQLARENCRLRKDLQKCKELLTEYTINYNILEVSWRRRGVSSSRFNEVVICCFEAFVYHLGVLFK
jgi:hypothetical protein